MSNRGCPGRPRHQWEGQPGEKRRCSVCGIVDGGRRVSRVNEQDRVPACSHHRQHKWLPDVHAETRTCFRCKLTVPLIGHGLARARRVSRIGERDGWACFYCRMPFSATLAGTPTEDHRIPRSLGGRNDLSNLVLACQRCNGWKAAGTERELRAQQRFQDRLVMVRRHFYRSQVPPDLERPAVPLRP